MDRPLAAAAAASDGAVLRPRSGSDGASEPLGSGDGVLNGVAATWSSDRKAPSEGADRWDGSASAATSGDDLRPSGRFSA